MLPLLCFYQCVREPDAQLPTDHIQLPCIWNREVPAIFEELKLKDQQRACDSFGVAGNEVRRQLLHQLSSLPVWRAIPIKIKYIFFENLTEAANINKNLLLNIGTSNYTIILRYVPYIIKHYLSFK